MFLFPLELVYNIRWKVLTHLINYHKRHNEMHNLDDYTHKLIDGYLFQAAINGETSSSLYCLQVNLTYKQISLIKWIPHIKEH